MKTLVIGGTHYAGLHLVRELVKQGHDVTIFNRGQTPAVLPKGVKRLYGDRKDHDAVRAALSGKKFDLACDVAAYTPEDSAIMVEVLEGNIGHFIFISTAGVYERRWTAPVLEDFPYNSVEIGSYAALKTKCEQLLLKAYKERGFPVTIIRPWLIFGPDNPLLERETLFFLRLERHRKILLPGNGFVHIQYGHVDDLARAFILIAENKQRTIGEAYNITGPDAITMNAYVATMARIIGVDTDIVYLNPEEVFPLPRSINPFHTNWAYSKITSIQKAKEHFGYSPQYNSEACTRHSYQWYKEKGLDKMEWDFSQEDELIKKLGNDPKRVFHLPLGGPLPVSTTPPPY
ncbi:MAG: SDR family oxidoreductase [Chloroflexota bacterium]